MAIIVTSEEFRPTFFQDHHPYILILGGSSQSGLFVIRINRKQIIHDNFLINPIKIQLTYIVTIRIVLLSLKQFFDSQRILGQRGASRQEVAVIELTLKDIVWSDFRRE